MKARPYQIEAAQSITEEWTKHQSTLAVLATGLGKTFLAAMLAVDRADIGRTMFLAHREELIWQAAETMTAAFGRPPQVEMADRRAEQDMFSSTSGVVVSSVQTQYSGMSGRGRMTKFKVEDFATLIVDEAHHYIAPAFRRVIDYYMQNPNLRVLGITATPDRSDKLAMGRLFKSSAYNYGIRPGIDDGWLVNIDQWTGTISGIDLSNVGTVAGDLNAEQLAEVMERNGNVYGVADRTLARVGDRRSLVFAASINHARLLAAIFNDRKPGSAQFVCKDTPRDERRHMLAQYARNEFQFLCNVGVATEGFNDPGIECVVVARPTKSRSLYCCDEATEVLTPRGWVRGVDLHCYDRVAGFDPKSGKIKWERIQQHVLREVFDDESMVVLRSPSIDLRVTNTHRMVYRICEGRKRIKSEWKIMQAGDLLLRSDDWELPASGVQDLYGLALSDDEVAFIGLVQTDGNYNPKNGQITIYQQQASSVCVDIEKILTGCGFKWRKHPDAKPTNFGPRSSPLMRYTISRGIPRGEDKHLRGWNALAMFIPKVNIAAWKRLDRLTVKQFEVLLHAMHLGDGYKNRVRGYSICTADELHANEIQSMCVRRGWRCNIATYQNANPGGPIFMIHASKGAARHVGGFKCSDRPKLMFDSKIKNERVWCVSVPSGAIVIRRNGKCCIVGNTQMAGRGTRPIPGVVDGYEHADDRKVMIAESAKPACELIDFVGNAGRHKLVTAADILGGDYETEVVERAKELCIDAPQAVNVEEALEIANAEIRERRRQEAEEARRAAQLKVTARCDYEKVDPFSYEGSKLNPNRRPTTQSRTRPATEAMQRFLNLHGPKGVESSEMSIGEAGKLIGEIRRRWDQGICSIDQNNLLKAKGLPTDIPKDTANAWIDEMKRNRWQVTPNLRAQATALLSVTVP